MDLGQVGQLRKDVFVPERDVDQSVVDKGGEGVGDGGLLPTALGAGGDKDAAHLAGEGAPAPEWAGCVPECLMNPDKNTHAFTQVRGGRTFHCTGKLP